MRICYECFKTFDREEEKCPFCGFDSKEYKEEVYYLKPGSKINDRYIIGKVIGFGGFGIVYTALDETLNQVVAIKEYFPTIYINRLEDSKEIMVFDVKNVELFEKGKQDFLLEARKIAEFNKHPNIVHIFDFFEENGTSYFVMEYIEAYTLKEYIAEAKRQKKVFTVESAVKIAKELLNALDAVHKKGIIHRDVKPANIFILDDGTVKVIDFGAARLSDTEERTRTIIITPGYAPPEQYQLNSIQGPHTDIYAVGAIMYEMLTGVKLEESINRKVEDVIYDPERINSKIPRYVNNIIMRALAVQPEIRFKNAEEFGKALASEKIVKNAKDERKKRKTWRNVRIFGIAAIVIGFALFCGYKYISSYRTAVLAETEINMWIPAVNGDISQTELMYESMLEEFSKNNEQVTVELKVIDEQDYADAIRNALISGNGPELFESSSLGADMNVYMAELSEFWNLNEFNADNYYFLSNYSDYSSECKKIPLSFDIPIVYLNEMRPELELSDSYDDYINDKSAYNGSILDYQLVQRDMAGKYSIKKEIDSFGKGRFDNTWSVNTATDSNSQLAAMRIIYYMLSDNSQEILTIENEQGIPINKNIWKLYTEINSDFSYLTDIMEQNSIERLD